MQSDHPSRFHAIRRRSAPAMHAREAQADASRVEQANRRVEQEPLAHSIAEVARRLGVSRGKVYAAIRDGRLRAIAWERRTLVMSIDLHAFLATLPALQPRDPRHE